MDSVEDANKVTQFCEICGSDRETAEHVLDAHGWDLDRSIGFFLEHGASMPATVQHQTVPDQVEVPAVAADAPPARPSAPGPQPASAAEYHTTIVEEEEDPDFDPEYEQALQESRLAAGEAQLSGRVSDPGEMEFASASFDAGNDDLQTLARHRANRINAEESDEPSFPASGMPRGFFNRPHARRSRRVQTSQDPMQPPPGLMPGLVRPGSMGMPGPSGMPAGTGEPSLAGASLGEAGNGFAHSSHPDTEFPAGINVEEARMLEAAMLGIPYEGRIPSFGADEEAQPTPLSVLAQRQLRAEQDSAFQQSLQADKAKLLAVRQAEEAQAAAAQAAADQQRQESEAAERKAVEHSQLMCLKTSRLPAEPAASDSTAVTVAVRVPSGSRISRRFLEQDPVQALFDWVDLQSNGQASDVRPGTYALVTQYPRQVFKESHKGSLGEAGFRKQQAFLIETG